MCTIKAKRHDNDNDNGIANLSFIKKEGFMPLVSTFHQCRSDIFIFCKSRFHRLLCPVKSNESPVSDPSASRFDPCQSRRPCTPRPLRSSERLLDRKRKRKGMPKEAHTHSFSVIFLKLSTLAFEPRRLIPWSVSSTKLYYVAGSS